MRLQVAVLQGLCSSFALELEALEPAAREDLADLDKAWLRGSSDMKRRCTSAWGHVGTHQWGFRLLLRKFFEVVLLA